MQQCDAPKGIPQCGPSQQQIAVWHHLCFSCLCRFLVKKSSQHAHWIHEYLPSKSCRASVSKLFQILRCSFSGKGDRLRIHEESPTQFATNSHWTFLWHAWVSPHFATKETQQVCLVFPEEGLTSPGKLGDLKWTSEPKEWGIKNTPFLWRRETPKSDKFKATSLHVSI